MDADGKFPLPESSNIISKFCNSVIRTLEAPGDFIKNNIVRPNQQIYPYYHEKVRRVPTIDQCYDDDVVCKFEADQQYFRDKKVDSHILAILRSRFEDCIIYEGQDHHKCDPIYETYKEAELNWFVKYGDLGVISRAEECYMKQKHRMAWERRHGEVGTGMKENKTDETGTGTGTGKCVPKTDTKEKKADTATGRCEPKTTKQEKKADRPCD